MLPNPEDPIGIGDIHVNLGPHRHRDLPAIYQTFQHPKRPLSTGRIFYFIQDTSKSGLKHSANLEKTLKIPQGDEAEAVRQGYLKLCEDDIVFVRSRHAPATGELDVAVCWVTGGQTFSDMMKTRMLAIRDRIIGPRHLRTRTAPTKDANGKLQGGTPFEHQRASPVHPNTRCFGIGNSYEGPTKIMAPHKNDKVKGDEDRECLEMREELLKIGAQLAMASLREGPEEILTNISLNAGLINTPAMGSNDNIAYTAAQLNMAPAEPHDSDRTLSAAIGLFGGEHRDKKDHPAYYSHMSSLSDLPDNFDPGRFFILHPGVFITLENFACINFSGLRYHGGTPPRAPPGTPASVLEWAIRFCLIHYPPRGQTKGEQRYALGALPDKTTFFVAPEMTGEVELEYEDRSWCTHAQYCEDGRVVQEREAHVKFISRALYGVSKFFGQQLPEEYGLIIDPDLFMKAFTYRNKEGQRISADEWELAPGHRRTQALLSSPPSSSQSAVISFISFTASNISPMPVLFQPDEFISQDKVREDARAKYQAYARHVSAHIPYEVVKSNGVAPLDLWELELGVERGGLGEEAYCSFITSDDHDDNNVGENNMDDSDADDDLPLTENAVEKRKGGRPAGTEKKKRKIMDTADGKQSGRGNKRSKKNTRTAEEKNSVDHMYHAHLPNTHDLEITLPNFTGIWPSSSSASSPVDEDQVNALNLTVDKAPVFLSDLTTELIKAEFDDIRRSVSLAQEKPQVYSATTNIDRLLTALTTSSVDASILADMASGWALVHGLEVDSHTSSLILRKQRMAVMLFSHRLWYWVDVYIGQAIKDILDSGNRDDLPWLGCLIAKVQDLFNRRIKKVKFLPSACGIPGLESASCTIEWTETWPRLRHTCDRAIALTVNKILRTWFFYPAESTARPQAWFIHVIITQIGSPLLYLDHIWKIYSNIHRKSFQRGSWRLDSFEHVQMLCEAAPHHPLFNHNSEDYKMLQDLVQLLDVYYSGGLLTANTSHQVMLSQEITPQSKTLQSIGESRLDVFKKFISNAMQHCLSNLDSSFKRTDDFGPPIPEHLKRFTDDPDRTLPFRELAPGRIRFKSAEGPFAPNVVRTTVGIFSGLIFRGITFTTQFSLQAPMVFTSLADFEKHRIALTGGKPSTFFCNIRAYGVPNAFRTHHLATHYWNALQDEVWPEFVGNRMVPFLEGFKFFRQQSEKSVNMISTNGSTKPTAYLFPNLGPLGSYLLSADLVYAGIFSPPTLDDIAFIIRHINRGAAAALEDFGCITRKSNTNMPKFEECKAGGQMAFQAILDVIPADFRDQLVTDFILLENALCKFSRVVGKK